jgi:hypothetical protein
MGAGSARMQAKEPDMNDISGLVDLYIATWNEPDAENRRSLIARVWAEAPSYVDPMLRSDGRDGIDAMIRDVQGRFPGHRFSRSGEVEAHHDRLRFRWELASAAGDAVVEGTDFAVLADGRLLAVTGFFDRVATSAQA